MLQLTVFPCALLATLVWAVPALPCVAPRANGGAASVASAVGAERGCCAVIETPQVAGCCAQRTAPDTHQHASNGDGGCSPSDGCQCPPGCPAPCGGGKLPCAPAEPLAGALILDPLSALIATNAQGASECGGEAIFHPPRG